MITLPKDELTPVCLFFRTKVDKEIRVQKQRIYWYLHSYFAEQQTPVILQYMYTFLLGFVCFIYRIIVNMLWDFIDPRTSGLLR